MVANTAPIFVLVSNNAEQTFVNADGTTPKDLVSASTFGSKIFSINVTSDDTVAVDLEVYMHDGTTAYLLATVTVPTLSGTDGFTPAMNLLASVPGADGDGELFIPSGYKMQVGPKAAVTAAKTVTIVCLGGDY